MNKIYKVVWSKAKHAYVVTSEVAKSHTKSASGKAVKAALAAAVGMGSSWVDTRRMRRIQRQVPAAAWRMVRAVTRRKQKMWPLAKGQVFPIPMVQVTLPVILW
ncbi:ESPR domain-containing protein [Dialister invisus]